MMTSENLIVIAQVSQSDLLVLKFYPYEHLAQESSPLNLTFWY